MRCVLCHPVILCISSSSSSSCQTRRTSYGHAHRRLPGTHRRGRDRWRYSTIQERPAFLPALALLPAPLENRGIPRIELTTVARSLLHPATVVGDGELFLTLSQGVPSTTESRGSIHHSRSAKHAFDNYTSHEAGVIVVQSAPPNSQSKFQTSDARGSAKRKKKQGGPILVLYGILGLGKR